MGRAKAVAAVEAERLAGNAPEKLTGFYRAMMAPMARLVSRAPAETEADRAMRDAFRDGGDWVSPERLAPVLAWLDGD